MGETHDVVIVGAGPGGSAAAHYLASHGLSVLLLDKSEFPRDKTCGDGLTPRALAVLDEMGLTDDLLRLGRRINGVAIVAPRGHSVTAALPRRPNLPPYSMVVPRLILDNLIQKRALASGAEFKGSVRVTAIAREGSGVAVVGENREKSFKARGRIAVVATGASPTLLVRIGVLKNTPSMGLAARAYVDDMIGLADRFHLSYERVPLPGYGWVFPLSDKVANVGAGVSAVAQGASPEPRTARRAFDAFMMAPSLQPMLANARRRGPIRGFPIRSDFATAPTYGDRVLLVGEAAGLVNPLTGEGVDYALESGRVAAEHLIGMFSIGDLSPDQVASYDRRLRQVFQNLFTSSNRIQRLLINRFMINRTVKAAAHHEALMALLVNVALGNETLSDASAIGTIARVIPALVRA